MVPRFTLKSAAIPALKKGKNQSCIRRSRRMVRRAPLRSWSHGAIEPAQQIRTGV